MKIAWWDYVRSNEDVFTQTTTTNRLPVWDELVRRGHQFQLVHIPRSVEVPNATRPGTSLKPAPDTGRYAAHWWAPGYEMHQRFVKRAKQLAGNDASFRMAKHVKDLVDQNVDPLYDCDVLVVKIQPMIAMLTRLELTSVILRHARAGVPVVVIDGEYQFSAIRTGINYCLAMNEGPNKQGLVWDKTALQQKIQVWTPYQRRVWANQAVMYYVYDPTRELPLPNELGFMTEFELGYVGNDYQRQEYLEKFYKHTVNGVRVKNAVWGRWDLAKWPSLIDTVGEDAFLGTLPPAQIHAAYQRCAASVVIAHRKYYTCGMLTQRFSEVTEAGRLLLVDADLYGAHHLLVSPTLQRVDSAEQAHAVLETLCQEGAYWDLVHRQRQFLRAKRELTPGYWADGIEAQVRGHGWTARQPELEDSSGLV